MQCGIELLVKNNKVVGFEPWMEFPFNEGRLCPKGVQRYLQNNHPDRLLDPLMRSEGVGFVPTTWDNAYDDDR
jgi:assimilatory nitrate reductase catalytic subunit